MTFPRFGATLLLLLAFASPAEATILPTLGMVEDTWSVGAGAFDIFADKSVGPATAVGAVATVFGGFGAVRVTQRLAGWADGPAVGLSVAAGFGFIDPASNLGFGQSSVPVLFLAPTLVGQVPFGLRPSLGWDLVFRATLGPGLYLHMPTATTSIYGLVNAELALALANGWEVVLGGNSTLGARVRF